MIAGLSLTGAHYKAAKTSLTKRYGRTERLIFISIYFKYDAVISQKRR